MPHIPQLTKNPQLALNSASWEIVGKCRMNSGPTQEKEPRGDGWRAGKSAGEGSGWRTEGSPGRRHLTAGTRGARDRGQESTVP